jgi:hypothetical protein
MVNQQNIVFKIDSLQRSFGITKFNRSFSQYDWEHNNWGELENVNADKIEKCGL